ncbi:MAG TPA: hypothetical protein VJQ79_07715 [Acidimicrobiia bacterium]|nr:hypothetical protein [Acidimicrobiia bacterium]
MDARSYAVAALFAFAGGLLVPRTGPDRKAVLVALILTAAIGVVVWLFSDDPFAGPSLTVGGVSGLLGLLARRPDRTAFSTPGDGAVVGDDVQPGDPGGDH